jgi:hypothetical protein
MEDTRKQVTRTPLIAERVRRIDGGFSFVPHRFLTDGFFASLLSDEQVLYFFLILAGDRNGVSFYGADSMLSLLCMEAHRLMTARRGLIDKDLIAFDGRRYQVLSLPKCPVMPSLRALLCEADFAEQDSLTIRAQIRSSLDAARGRDV